MLTFMQRSLQPLRAWLLIAALIMTFSSLIEAGHAHGVLTPINDECVLCQHWVVLDHAIVGTSAASTDLVLFANFSFYSSLFFPNIRAHLALIRAPPK